MSYLNVWTSWTRLWDDKNLKKKIYCSQPEAVVESEGNDESFLRSVAIVALEKDYLVVPSCGEGERH